MKKPYVNLQGVFAATVCVMHDDGSIDWEGTHAHIRKVARLEGITGVFVNGHAGEGGALSRLERQEMVRVARAAAGEEAQLITGIHARVGFEAAAEAKDAQMAGANGALIWPPDEQESDYDATSIIRHHESVANGCDLPLLLYTAAPGLGSVVYSEALVRDLCGIDRVVGIKDGSWDTLRYDILRRAAREASSNVSVLASSDEHLLPSFALGTEGTIVSLAALIPESIVRLWRAVVQSRLDLARMEHETIYPIARGIYGSGMANATVRLKFCMRLLGLIDSNQVRQPLKPVPEPDQKNLVRCLEAPGLL